MSASLNYLYPTKQIGENEDENEIICSEVDDYDNKSDNNNNNDNDNNDGDNNDNNGDNKSDREKEGEDEECEDRSNNEDDCGRSSIANTSELTVERAISQGTGATSLDVLEESRDGMEDDPFSSARSSFASKSELFESDLDLPEISYDLPPEELEQPLKVEKTLPLASSRLPWASSLRLASNHRCYMEFCELNEETKNDSMSNVTFHFAVACEERSTFFGWFYSLMPISGYGYSFNTDGSYYVGELKDGKKSGFGVFYYDNGSHYDGYWEENQKQGDGKFYFNDDLYYRARWSGNKMVDCKLEYNASVYTDVNGVFGYISTHNDYIFFKQAQLCR